MFKIFIRRPVLSIVVSLVIAFIGILSLSNLPITQFPSISPPKVNVIANYPGANNELLVKSVIIPLEQALNGIFSAVLNQSNLQLSENMTTDDIENWDSLTNMTIISEIEKRWDIHFKLRDIIRMKNIGDMADAIISKSQQ